MKNKYKKKKTNYPYSVGLAITNRCNLNCIHCNMSSGKEKENELTKQECFKLIDEFAMKNISRLMFLGGEPLVRKDFFEIANYAINKKIPVGFTTNGILINKELILKELYKFNLIRVSLDSPEYTIHEKIRNKKGVFDITLNNIKLLVRYGIDVAVVTCVSHLNYDKLEEFAKLLTDIGVTRWNLPIFSPFGRGENINEQALTPLEIREFLILLSDISKKYKNLSIGLDIPYAVMLPEYANKRNESACPAGVTEIMVFSDGNISPCCQITKMSGNVRNHSIEDIWNNDQIFINFRDRSKITGKCSSCEYLMQCGGCRANAFIRDGNYLGEDRVCWKV